MKIKLLIAILFISIIAQISKQKLDSIRSVEIGAYDLFNKDYHTSYDTLDYIPEYQKALFIVSDTAKSNSVWHIKGYIHRKSIMIDSIFYEDGSSLFSGIDIYVPVYQDSTEIKDLFIWYYKTLK